MEIGNGFEVGVLDKAQPFGYVFIFHFCLAKIRGAFRIVFRLKSGFRPNRLDLSLSYSASST